MKSFVFALITMSLIGVAQPGHPALDENLVVFFDFEGSGNIAEDRSGNGNDGAIIGAERVEGRIGKGLSFDGDDDDLGFPLNGLSAAEGSVLMWVKQLDVEVDNSRNYFKQVSI